jgi:hypothetical protein
MKAHAIHLRDVWYDEDDLPYKVIGVDYAQDGEGNPIGPMLLTVRRHEVERMIALDWDSDQKVYPW